MWIGDRQGRRSRLLTTPKIAAFAPMPKAGVSTTVAAKPGDRRTSRSASRTSCQTVSADIFPLVPRVEVDIVSSQPIVLVY